MCCLNEVVLLLLRLMLHMQQHVSTMSQQDKHMDSVSSCPHCFRHFSSAFRLQCHLETVHSQYESTGPSHTNTHNNL